MINLDGKTSILMPNTLTAESYCPGMGIYPVLNIQVPCVLPDFFFFFFTIHDLLLKHIVVSGSFHGCAKVCSGNKFMKECSYS